MSALGLRAFARSRRPVAVAVGCGLAFDRPGGPLVAVCGLAGGAGTSTLALALARQAARESAAPVLLCESDSRAGGLAAIARVRSELSLGALARAALAGAPLPRAPFASSERGLRLIAAAAGAELGDPNEMRQILEEARATHGVVVVDGGLLGSTGAFVTLAAATHALVVMPATPAGVARAEQLLSSKLAPRHGVTLAAVAPAERALRARDLRELGERYVERLVLVPHIAALQRGEPSGGQLELVVAAIATAILRPR